MISSNWARNNFILSLCCSQRSRADATRCRLRWMWCQTRKGALSFLGQARDGMVGLIVSGVPRGFRVVWLIYFSPARWFSHGERQTKQRSNPLLKSLSEDRDKIILQIWRASFYSSFYLPVPDAVRTNSSLVKKTIRLKCENKVGHSKFSDNLSDLWVKWRRRILLAAPYSRSLQK